MTRTESGSEQKVHRSTVCTYHDLTHLDAFVTDLIERTPNILVETIRLFQDAQPFVPRGTLRTMHCETCGRKEEWQFVLRPLGDVADQHVWECTGCGNTLPYQA